VHPHTKNVFCGSDGLVSDGVWWGVVWCGCDGVAFVLGSDGLACGCCGCDVSQHNAYVYIYM